MSAGPGAFDAAAADAVLLAPLLWEPVAAATVARSAPAAGERVLDACCGTGPSALLAAAAVGPAGAVDAVDVSSAAVAQLQQAARSAGGLPCLEAHTADATAWPGRGYDLVQCVLGVFFLLDPAAGTEHLVRCARPGGRVVITTWATGALAVAGRALVEAVAAVREEALPAWSASAAAQQLGEGAALAAWVGARGLDDVVVTRHPHAVPASAEELWLLVLGSGFRGLLSGLAAAQVARVRDLYLSGLAGGDDVDATFLVATGHRPEVPGVPSGA